jgi:hypothetical protein
MMQYNTSIILLVHNQYLQVSERHETKKIKKSDINKLRTTIDFIRFDDYNVRLLLFSSPVLGNYFRTTPLMYPFPVHPYLQY